MEKFLRWAITAVAADFHVCRKTITNIWTRAQQNHTDPTVRQYPVSPRKKRNCARKKKWDPKAVMEAIKEIPLFQRRMIRDLAAALGIPKSTLFNLKNNNNNPVIMPCSNALQPQLTEHHKLMQTLFCVTKVNPDNGLYEDHYQSVHVDLKWSQEKKSQITDAKIKSTFLR